MKWFQWTCSIHMITTCLCFDERPRCGSIKVIIAVFLARKYFPEWPYFFILSLIANLSGRKHPLHECLTTIYVIWKSFLPSWNSFIVIKNFLFSPLSMPFYLICSEGAVSCALGWKLRRYEIFRWRRRKGRYKIYQQGEQREGCDGVGRKGFVRMMMGEENHCSM